MESSERVIRALVTLGRSPGVQERVSAALQGCTDLRWHEALRRRTQEAAAESRVRGAVATAFLDGAEPAGSAGSVDLVRDLMRGAAQPDAEQPVDAIVQAAMTVTAHTEHVSASQLRAPWQVLAGLHLAAASRMLPAEQVGRPRNSTERCLEHTLDVTPPAGAALHERLEGIGDFVRAHEQVAATPEASVICLAALVHAEIMTVRPFVTGNGLVARALTRIMLKEAGVDPTGVSVPEIGHTGKAGADYRGALAAYASGNADGVRLWVLHCADAVAAGAQEGARVADAVRAGSLGAGAGGSQG